MAYDLHFTCDTFDECHYHNYIFDVDNYDNCIQTFEEFVNHMYFIVYSFASSSFSFPESATTSTRWQISFHVGGSVTTDMWIESSHSYCAAKIELNLILKAS